MSVPLESTSSLQEMKLLDIKMLREERLNMTKKDLKTGMVVETKDGRRYLVLAECQHLAGMKRNMEYETHKDDLTYYKDDLTICKVYKPSMSNLEEMLNNPGDPIWKREEAKEHTLAEIEKLLGYPVKIVKE